MILAYPYAHKHAQYQHLQAFCSLTSCNHEALKMQSTHPIKAFFARLAMITALLLTGDYLDFIALTQQAIHATGQALADSTAIEVAHHE